MKIIVSGDIHGQFDIRKLSNHKVISEFGSLPDVLIITGDFGVPWSNDLLDRQDKYLREWYESKPYKVLVIPGNHENYGRISLMPQVSIYGATAHQYGSNIFFIDKNEILTIDNTTFYCFGGATSTDQSQRIPYTSWWPEEDATYSDFIKMQEKLIAYPSVDYIITHTCPERWVPLLGDNFHSFDNCPTRKVLDYLAENINYTTWFFGHFHIDKQLSENNAVCLYNILKEI